MSVGCFTATISQMAEYLARVVKATIESTLGHLGTVGAMVIDEFVMPINAAMGNVHSTEAHRTIHGEEVLTLRRQ